MEEKRGERMRGRERERREEKANAGSKTMGKEERGRRKGL